MLERKRKADAKSLSMDGPVFRCRYSCRQYTNDSLITRTQYFDPHTFRAVLNMIKLFLRITKYTTSTTPFQMNIEHSLKPNVFLDVVYPLIPTCFDCYQSLRTRISRKIQADSIQFNLNSTFSGRVIPEKKNINKIKMLIRKISG